MASLDEAGKGGDVAFAKRTRHDQLGDRSPDRLVTTVAERLFGSGIEFDHPAGRVRDDDAVECRLEIGADALVCLDACSAASPRRSESLAASISQSGVLPGLFVDTTFRALERLGPCCPASWR